MHARFTAILDACVLYPAPLRDFLMRLALTDQFCAKWTAQIHDEWIRNVRANRSDIPLEKLERTRDLMNKHAEGCLVTGYECLIEQLALPDADDRHVLAAAIVGRADVIVTFNLKDFPERVLEPLGLEAQHPDEFILHLLDLAPTAVLRAFQEQLASLRRPPHTVEQLLDTLERQQLPASVGRLRELLNDP